MLVVLRHTINQCMLPAYTDFPYVLTGEAGNAVGASLSVFRNRILGIRRTCSDIFSLRFIPMLVNHSNDGEDSGLLPNVHTGVYYQTNMPHCCVVKTNVLKLQPLV